MAVFPTQHASLCQAKSMETPPRWSLNMWSENPGGPLWLMGFCIPRCIENNVPKEKVLWFVCSVYKSYELHHRKTNMTMENHGKAPFFDRRYTSSFKCLVFQPVIRQAGGGRSVSQASGEQKKPPVLIPVVHEDTVDGKNPANQLRLVVYPLIYKVFYIQTVVRRISEPSTVCQVENCSALSDTECASEKSLCRKVKTGSLESSGLSKIPCPKNPNTSSRIEGSYLIPQEYRENPGVLGYIWILRGWFFLNLLGIMATRSEKYLGHWMSLEWSWTCFTPWNEQPKKPLKKWNAGLPLSFWGV